MKELFKILCEQMKIGNDTVLLTIIASSGSTPRGEGAHMLVGAQGRICGTIGGGAVEYRSEQLAVQILKEQRTMTKAFKLTADDVENLGMICGGDVTVFFRYISAADTAVQTLCDKLLGAFEKERDIWLIADITDQEASAVGGYIEKEGFVGLEPEGSADELLCSHPVRVELNGRLYYSEPIARSGRVLIFGGGHIAQELVPLLTHLDFRCTVMDDRVEFANAEIFPDADKIVCADFEDIFASLFVRENDYGVVLTRGHAYDYTVQRQLHTTPIRYIGVIGSRKKMAAVFEKLRADGVSQEALNQVHTPIGTAIKAQSPAEIAVSIAGELILERAERGEGR